MNEKPKIITKLERLYLLSGGIFFLDSILAFSVLINGIFPALSNPSADQSLVGWCSTIFIGGSILSFLFGVFILKIRNLTIKGDKLAITEGRTLSLVSLLIFIGPTIFLILMCLGYSFPPIFSWVTLLFFLIFLTLFINVLIIATSLTPQVRAYCKEQSVNK